MSYYQRGEQETMYSYSVPDGYWRIYSTYPPDIRKILENAADVIREEKDSSGRVISVEARADKNQVRLYKPRIP